MSENISFVVCFAIFGLVIIVLGVGARLGYFKTLYLIKGIPGLYPSGYIYAFLPIGIGAFLFMIALLLPDRELGSDLTGLGSFVIIILSIILMTWKPSWLRPKWLKWLEFNYAHVLELMLDEARNTWNWNTEPKTQAELEQWADDVAKKHGWRRLQ